MSGERRRRGRTKIRAMDLGESARGTTHNIRGATTEERKPHRRCACGWYPLCLAAQRRAFISRRFAVGERAI